MTTYLKTIVPMTVHSAFEEKNENHIIDKIELPAGTHVEHLLTDDEEGMYIFRFLHNGKDFIFGVPLGYNMYFTRITPENIAPATTLQAPVAAGGGQGGGKRKSRKGKSRKGKSRKGKSRKGKSRKGKSRKRKSRKGKSRKGKSRKGKSQKK